MTQPVYTIPESYFEFLETHARQLRGKTALEIFSDGARTGCSYEELYRSVRAIGSGLVNLGVQPGDRVALLAENNPDWGVAFLGIWAAGGICVPLDFHLSDAEVCNLVNFSECRHLFIAPKRLEDIRNALGPAAEKIRFIRMASMDGHRGDAPSFQELAQTPGRQDVPYRASHQDTAAILFTSGTSSDPKGVSLSHGNLLHHNAALLHGLDVCEKDSILGVLPLHHALALNANFLVPLSVGARITYLPAVTSQSILHGIREASITVFACIPQFYYLVHRNILFQVQSRGVLVRWSFSALKKLSRLLRQRLGVQNRKWLFPKIHAAFGEQLRILASAGSYLDPEVILDLSDLGFNLFQAYGMTESTAAMTVTPVSDNRLGSVGRPLPGVEVKIVDADGQGKGEVIGRGPNVMQGYYKRPDLTEATIRDGWLHTGDLGCFDSDGHLYITGRIKDVIVLRNGKNIYPDELERHFLQCPMIKEVCVLGVEAEDGGGRGEKLHLVAVPDFDYLRQQKIANAGESIRFEMESLSRKLPSHQHITSMEVQSESLPRTTTQKIRRGQLKRQVEARLRAGTAAVTAPLRPAQSEPLTGPHAALVSKLIHLQKKPAFELSGRHNLELDLGFDSLERLELLSAIEQQSGLQVSPELVPNIYTLQDLLNALEQSTAEGRLSEEMAAADRRSWSRLLASRPDDAIEKKYFLDSKPVLAVVSYTLLRIAYLIARILFRLKVTGIENLPRERPFLICPNHLSYIDAFLVCACLPFRILKNVFFVGFSEYFQGRLSSWFGRAVNVIPIDPDAKLNQAMRLAAEGLRHDKILCIFPEGSRSIDGRLQAFHRGAAILAAERQAPMIPVGLIGPYEVWPRDSWRIRFHPLKVHFGKPVYPINGIPEGEPYPYDQLTDQLRCAVAQLINEPASVA